MSEKEIKKIDEKGEEKVSGGAIAPVYSWQKNIFKKPKNSFKRKRRSISTPSNAEKTENEL